MNDGKHDLIETFNRWISNLPQDAALMQDAALCEEMPRPARRLIVGSLDYLPRRFDIIPDHFTDIGSLDDVFVLRVGAMLALKSGLGENVNLDLDLKLQKLAADAEIIKSFLGTIFPLFVAYVVRLPDVTVRGRNADRALDDKEVLANILREVRQDIPKEAAGTVKDDAALDQVRLFIKDKCTLSLPG